MKKYKLSKNYKELQGSGNKAKTDIERIVARLGYANAGLRQATYKNPIVGFSHTFISVIKSLFTLSAGDVLLVQYPFKKYYSLICRMAHWKKAKVITLIHDLGSFRRKKLTVEEEIARLKGSDVLIVHNEKMKEWLLREGYGKPMVSLEIFDYLSDAVPAAVPVPPPAAVPVPLPTAVPASISAVVAAPISAAVFDTAPDAPKEAPEGVYNIVYAGALGYKKNSFLYKIDWTVHTWRLSLYGKGWAESYIHPKGYLDYKGFVPSERLIQTASGHFGLVWDGDSVSTCVGAFGEYLKYNNPHKTSLYIRCHLPIIIWEKAALATFVAENRIGFCINSLDELDSKLLALSPETYAEMKQNVIKISQRLSSGYYTIKAIEEAEKSVYALNQ